MGVVLGGSFSQRRWLTPVERGLSVFRRLAAAHRGVKSSQGLAPVQSFSGPRCTRPSFVGWRGPLMSSVVTPVARTARGDDGPSMRLSLAALGRVVTVTQAELAHRSLGAAHEAAGGPTH